MLSYRAPHRLRSQIVSYVKVSKPTYFEPLYHGVLPEGRLVKLYRFGYLSATWLVACTSEGLLVRSN